MPSISSWQQLVDPIDLVPLERSWDGQVVDREEALQELCRTEQKALGLLASIDSGQRSPPAQIDDGTAKIKGDRKVLGQLASILVEFELGFEILPGTKAPAEAKVEKKGPFEQDLRQMNE